MQGRHVLLESLTIRDGLVGLGAGIALACCALGHQRVAAGLELHGTLLGALHPSLGQLDGLVGGRLGELCIAFLR